MPIKKEHAQGRGTRAEGKEAGWKEGRKEGRMGVEVLEREKGEFGDEYTMIFFSSSFSPHPNC